MPRRWLPLVIAVLPLAAIAASYLVAARMGFVPACNPFLEGCTSISATGRHAPASYIFKPAHLLVAALLTVFWNRLAAADIRGRRSAAGVRVAGLFAAGALVVYTLTLGSQTPLYEFMRRFGIYFFFIGTVFAQLFATLDLRATHAQGTAGGRALGWMLAMCVAPALLGAFNFIQKAVATDPDPTENRIEWACVVLMQAWFVFLYRYVGQRDFSRPGPTSGDRP